MVPASIATLDDAQYTLTASYVRGRRGGPHAAGDRLSDPGSRRLS